MHSIRLVLVQRIYAASHIKRTAQSQHALYSIGFTRQIVHLILAVNQLLVARVTNLIIVDCTGRWVLFLNSLQIASGLDRFGVYFLDFVSAAISALLILRAVVSRRKTRILTGSEITTLRGQGTITAML